MNHVEQPTWQANLIYLLFLLLFVVAVMQLSSWFRRVLVDFKKGNTFAYWLLFPAVVGTLAVVLFPFLYNFYLSFSNLSLRNFHHPEIVGLQNYLHILQDPTFYSVFFKTILWTVTNVFFHVAIGLFLALLIHQTLPAKPLFRTLLIIPWAVPQYITALTWRGMFNQEYGLINHVVHDLLNGPAIQWFATPLKAFAACLLTNVWLGFPFMMMVTLGGLQAIPKELYEAAEVDGASSWQIFRRITWPLLQPVLRPAIVLGLIWTFNNLNVVWLVSNGGEPADQTQILVSYVYKSAFTFYHYSSSAALSMIIFVILLFATAVYMKTSAMKLFEDTDNG